MVGFGTVETLARLAGETPVFTVECSHAFHFPCIIAHVRSHASLAYPICSTSWCHAPFLSVLCHREDNAPAVK
ncbi:hypothetical protein C4D60_Mb02t12430 [Musa balbisiana]|uniref:Zinc finger C3HC4 RING-type domain-containing protein n=1 Tax=Musa balbisiana TaxID=52838 RepID=A0A4S8IA58_MUSBA|nr:hypothetical protein C4D60_Mb02t12430 [Musa balbisiana]